MMTSMFEILGIFAQNSLFSIIKAVIFLQFIYFRFYNIHVYTVYPLPVSFPCCFLRRYLFKLSL